MSEAPPERRAAPRTPVRIEAAYEDAERQVFLTTRDLSETGAYLVAPDPPQAGVEARLLLELPGHPQLLRLPGRVARREAGRGFALAFDLERLPSATRGTLRGFIEHG